MEFRIESTSREIDHQYILTIQHTWNDYYLKLKKYNRMKGLRLIRSTMKERYIDKKFDV